MIYNLSSKLSAEIMPSVSIYQDRLMTSKVYDILHLSSFSRKNLNLGFNFLGYSHCNVLVMVSGHADDSFKKFCHYFLSASGTSWHLHRAFVDYLSHMILFPVGTTDMK